MAESRINTKCSALTRAGISRKNQAYTAMIQFRPHKGGYIACSISLYEIASVPPSQGRVYRHRRRYIMNRDGSALTRAGISRTHDDGKYLDAFRPHKGGYIGLVISNDSGYVVPPSQGRVYHFP